MMCFSLAEDISEDGDLDDYMMSMNNRLDNATKTKIKRQVLELKKVSFQAY